MCLVRLNKQFLGFVCYYIQQTPVILSGPPEAIKGSVIYCTCISIYIVIIMGMMEKKLCP